MADPENLDRELAICLGRFTVNVCNIADAYDQDRGEIMRMLVRVLTKDCADRNGDYSDVEWTVEDG